MDPETRVYLDEMRQEMHRRFDNVDRRFDAMDRRFDGVGQRFGEVDRRFDEVRQQFADVDHSFGDVDRRFVQVDGELRRHFRVLIESVRHEIRIVAEMVAANTESIMALRVRLDAR